MLHAKIDHAKTIHHQPDGTLKAALNHDAHPKHFTAEGVPVESLSDLHDLFDLLQHDRKASVIRGALIEGVASVDVLRRKQESGRAFEAAARRWLTVDIDDLPLPDDLTDVSTHADTIIAHAIDQLPAEFQNVACVYQWSSSMMIKPGKVRVHLWFWLDRPITDDEAKAWLKPAPDRATVAPSTRGLICRHVSTNFASPPAPSPRQPRNRRRPVRRFVRR